MRYSKRKLEGLPVAKEIKISSLSEYVNLLSDGKFGDCIFRGEPTNFPETTSSALRKYSGGFKETKSEYPFIKMKNEFKRDVWHKLTQDERSDFLAFAQHHGIPTNLIDFTKSPLVALYFSCQSYKNGEGDSFDESNGFIYVLQNKLIDATDIISRNEDENILELFIHNKNDSLLNFYKYFCKYEEEYPFDFYKCFKQLYEDWNYYFVNLRSKPRGKPKFPGYNDGNYKAEISLNYKKFISDENLIDQIEEYCSDESFVIHVYTLLLQKFLWQIKEYTETVWWINCMPNFLYSPILSFERGRNQQGLFIYQAYLSFTESVYNMHMLTQQRIWADTIVVVENKEKILKELDFVGINEKFIYGDFDNIASYIKKMYQ